MVLHFSMPPALQLYVLLLLSACIPDIECESRFDAVFAEADEDTSKEASRNERDARGISNDTSLVYGEIAYGSFTRILRSLDLPPGGVFVDLGAGAGSQNAL
jgi:hypothetical protein